MKHIRQIFATCGMALGATLLFASTPYASRGEEPPTTPEGGIVASTFKTQELPVRERRVGVGTPIANLNKSQKRYTISASEDRKIEFMGSVIYYTAPGDGSRPRELGLAKYATDGSYETLLPSFGANGGGVFTDGKFHYVYKFIKDFGESGKIDIVYQFDVDLETMTISEPIEVGHEMIATDVAFDPISGNVYGCFYSDDLQKFQFGIIDYQNHKRSTIADLSIAYNALAFTDDGTLYGVDMNGNFCEVNKADGSKRVIGATGYVPYYVSSGAIDYRTGDFYWTVAPIDGSGFLCKIDKTTGRATKVLDFLYDEEITALDIPRPEADDKAPAALSDVSLSFPEGSMSGNISFTMPSTLFDGTPAEGECDYTVISDGETISSGSSSYGAAVNANITFTRPGRQVLSLYANNSVGRGPITRIDYFAGKDSPAIPTDINAEYADGTFTITWNKVDDSLEGGYIDPNEVKYTVTGYPWGNIITQSTSDTSCTYDCSANPDFTVYWFEVEAEYDGKKSGIGLSNKLPLGSYFPPSDIKFDNDNALVGWSIIDSNDDGISWQLVGDELGCPTNPLMSMDDWVISPKVHLNAGETYKISIDMRSNIEGFPEDLELCVGSSPMPDAMDDVVIGATRVTSTTPATFSGYFTADDEGDYYIGLHGVSLAFTNCLLISNLRISAPVNGNVPAAPSRFYGVRAMDGDQEQAKLSFRAPSKSLNGKSLESLSSIKILRNGAGQVGTIDNPTPGQDYEYIDNVPEKGSYTYTLIPVNAYGEGEEVSTIAYVLSDLPEKPESASATESGNSGYVTLEWDAITHDLSGFPLDPDEVSYTIATVDGASMEPVAQGLKDTRYEYQAVAEGKQDFRQYAIFGVNSTGEGIEKLIHNLAYGTPYSAPWRESIPHKVPGSILSSSRLEADGVWYALDDTNLEGVSAADSDGGFFCMTGSESGAAALLQFGKVDLSTLQKPTFSFFTYNFSMTGEGDDTNTIDLEVFDGNSWVRAESWTVGQACNGQPGWHRIYTSLDQWKGQIVQLRLISTLSNISVTTVDAIAVSDVFDIDASVSNIFTPENIYANQDFDITATVANYGKTDLSGLTVRLMSNGVEVDRIENYSVGSGFTKDVTFRQNVNAACDQSLTYSVIVDCDGDLNPSDNSLSAPASTVNYSELPTVRDLVETQNSDGSRVISWSAPEVEGFTGGSRIIENFESYDSFAFQDLGDWTLVDADGAETWTLSGISFPGIQNNQPLSYFVMDDSDSQFNSTWNAYSGHKYLSNIAAKETVNDDWLISPQLNGKAQTVSFYARSYNPAFKETFEFLVSDNSSSVEDFRLIERNEFISSDWTLYSYEIPEDSKFFAIRCTSNDELMFQVDDVSFTPALDRPLSIIGYNIYVDGKLFSSLSADELSWNSSPVATNAILAVSSLYNVGESRAVKVARAGISSILYDNVTVKGCRGSLIVANAENVDLQIFSVDGSILFSGKGEEFMKISAHPGIYVVRIGGKAIEVLVK